MQLLSYNGIVLECLVTRQMQETAVYSEDGSTYLYTRWEIDVDAVLHKNLTSYVAGNPPLSEKGHSPAETHEAIRRKLLQPRGKLKVISGDRTLLETPVAGRTTDCANGPSPQFCRVHKIFGEFNTWGYSFRIVAHVNECDSASPLLSHRWERTMDTSIDFFSTVTTAGRVRFRGDKLLADGKQADDFRQKFFHPVPALYQRVRAQVSPHEDGLGCNYLLVDQERPYGYGPTCPATRIEGMFSSGYASTSMIVAAGQGMQGVVANGAAQAGNALSGNPLSALWNFAFGSIDAANKAALSALPRYYCHAQARAWGARTSSKVELAKLVLGIVFSRASEVLRQVGAEEFRISQDFNGKFVEAELTVKWGDDLLPKLSSWLPGSAIAIASQVALENVFRDKGVEQCLGLAVPENEEIIVKGLPGNPGISINDTRFPPLPNERGTRGTSLLRLITAALQAECAGPITPPPTNVLSNNDAVA